MQRVPVTESQGRVHTVDRDRRRAARSRRESTSRSIRPTSRSTRSKRRAPAASTSTRPSRRFASRTCRPASSSRAARTFAIAKSRARDADAARDALDRKQREDEEAVGSLRRSQVGTGDRSEKIRTYNFPQDRITDHRINRTSATFAAIMDGDLGQLVDGAASRRTSPITRRRDAADDASPRRCGDAIGARNDGESPRATRCCCSRTSGASAHGSSPTMTRVLAKTHASVRGALERSAPGMPVAYHRWQSRVSTGASSWSTRACWSRARRPSISLKRRSRFCARTTPSASLDVGTGSGAIAVTLAARIAERIVKATDISPAALAVARDNARRLDVCRARARFYHGDLADAGARAAARRDRREPAVRSERAAARAPDPVAFEPLVALDGGPDGLDPYRRLLARLPRLLNARRHRASRSGTRRRSDGLRELARARSRAHDRDRRDYAGSTASWRARTVKVPNPG